MLSVKTMRKIPFTIANNWVGVDYPNSIVHWQAVEPNDKFIEYECIFKGTRWVVRINDFPDEPLYTLLNGDDEVIHSDNWFRFLA
jgi:hypothetical protein